MHRILNGAKTELVRCAVYGPALHATTCQPTGEPVVIVIVAIQGWILGDRRPAELAAPLDQRLVQ